MVYTQNKHLRFIRVIIIIIIIIIITIIIIIIGNWFEPWSISCLSCVIVRVRVVTSL